MSKVKIDLNITGFDQLRKSDEMQNILNEVAQQVADNAGTGFSTNIKNEKKRAVAEIRAETKEAKNAAYRENALVKALHK